MTKVQKIWFTAGFLMFLIPELLWSPIINISLDFFGGDNVGVLRENFLMNSDNINSLIFVLSLQTIGLLLSSFILYKSSIKKILKIFISLILYFLLIISGFITFLAFSLRHGIGF